MRPVGNLVAGCRVVRRGLATTPDRDRWPRDSCLRQLARCEFDRSRPADHNHQVVRSIGHLALVLALAPWMVSSAAVAPEHVHEADAHHAHSVTHRHIEAHDQDQTEIESGDGHILWLTGNVAVQYAAYHLAVGHFAVSAVFPLAPTFTTWMLASTLDGSPPHGPPRPYTPLRAPPPLSA